MGTAVQASFTFGQLLRRYRAAAGLTQEELAERAGLSGRGIADLERGARTAPYPQTVRRLADALRLRGDELAALLDARSAALPVKRHDRQATLTQAVAAGTLPEALTSFVGRDREIAEVAGLLRSTRGVTLVGPGGVGKTRLAIEVIRRLAAEYADGVCLVELAPLAQAELVVQATARKLGLRVELDQQPRSALIRFLARRELLLLLDNCEHLLDACAEWSYRSFWAARVYASWLPAASRWTSKAKRYGGSALLMNPTRSACSSSARVPKTRTSRCATPT
jgi:transcriptional regulator with XRE-family HTH domain